MLGMIGKKIGMTQIIGPSGDLVPVTVIEAGPVTVTAIRTKAKEGYDALQLGFTDVKDKHITTSQKKFFEKNQIKPKRHIHEFRVPANQKTPDYKIGQEISADFFEEGEFVDIQGTSIGKGFAGGMKRWGMKGGPETHGSMYHRRPGSGGSSTFPGRTWKGHSNPGQMGNVTKTMQSLLVLKVSKDDNCILVKGSVPGSKNSIIYIRKALKRSKIDLASLKVAPKGDKKDAAAAKKAPAKKPAAKK